MNPAASLHAAGFGIWTVVAVAVIATVLAMLIHMLQRSRRAGGRTAAQAEQRSYEPVAHPPAPVLPKRGPDLPDWSAADAPMLTLAELQTRLRAMAARGGIAENVLAHVGDPTGRDGEYLTVEGPNYLFTYWEQGGPMLERRSVIADQILYHALKDRAHMRAYMELVGQQLSPEEHAAKIAHRQEEILSAIDPKWARQMQLDRQQSPGSD